MDVVGCVSHEISYSYILHMWYICYECIIFDDGMAVFIPLQKYNFFEIFHFIMVMHAFDNSSTIIHVLP